MIPIANLLIVLCSAQAGLKSRDVFFAPKDKLIRIVGRDISRHGEPGITFARKGFSRIWVDTDGPKMSQARFYLNSQQSWKTLLSGLGLDVTHAKVAATSGSNSPSPMLRNRQVILGLGGVPKGIGAKPWTVAYVEYAEPNLSKISKVKSQIKASTGNDKLRLIRSCYDWNSEIDFVSR